MPYSAKAVANRFIDIAKKNKLPITPMKLQKLVYFAHGWFLSLTNGQSLIDERVEAWRFGPVVPSLYHEFKSCGNNPIQNYATEFVLEDSFEIITPTLPDDKNLTDFINKIWDVYGKFTAIQLSNMTHSVGTPWEQTWSEGIAKGTDISNEIIKDYFDKERGNKNAD